MSNLSTGAPSLSLSPSSIPIITSIPSTTPTIISPSITSPPIIQTPSTETIYRYIDKSEPLPPIENSDYIISPKYQTTVFCAIALFFILGGSISFSSGLKAPSSSGGGSRYIDYGE
jgi:hypothetical protein